MRRHSPPGQPPGPGSPRTANLATHMAVLGNKGTAMPEMLFYRRPETLRPQVHMGLRFAPLTSYTFAKEAKSVPLLAFEFIDACRTYPIVFSRGANESFQAHAILSLAEGGNTFIDEQGQWTTSYIPSYIRRYPFVLASLPDRNEFAVAFDADSGCFGTVEGNALYDESGASSAFLEKEIDFLRKLHHEHLRTEQLLKMLMAESLLSTVKVDLVRGGEQEKSSLGRFVAIDEDKLKKLPADKATKFLTDGVLALCYAQLISLKNFEALARREREEAA